MDREVTMTLMSVSAVEVRRIYSLAGRDCFYRNEHQSTYLWGGGDNSLMAPAIPPRPRKIKNPYLKLISTLHHLNL